VRVLIGQGRLGLGLIARGFNGAANAWDEFWDAVLSGSEVDGDLQGGEVGAISRGVKLMGIGVRGFQGTSKNLRKGADVRATEVRRKSAPLRKSFLRDGAMKFDL
jgi:hypothetical protein